ncbi:hypothetical protein A2841_02565 [Candidatus Kaiserbacteria bacterium RIFCSPHIGHO2_01_FULL_48_10]|uniref:Uncharacterized protein n=1 Tax=Candidatus Kaiserbacteria bacterium RIFCSPHIGHO2_01_FULL_48_10 TaxID=1798476 RepID=A0A1F6C369_9BACT|nr:MAG: hypothetical protein A2841_02565 [Candidatus Kaiserbacteria bacterium RIFCSPHIGHO2_01_FULL_48_10]
MKKLLVTGALGGAWALPLLAFAQTVPGGPGLGNILVVISRLIATATPIVVGLALLAFFWGLAMYIFNIGSDEGKKKGLQIMIWGIIALFVMVSVWGIVAVLGSTFGVGQGGSADLPFVDPRRASYSPWDIW